MTVAQLREFHRRRFCQCGARATRVVEGQGYCTRHLARAEDAAADNALRMDSMKAAHEFAFDKRRSVTRDYRYSARVR